MHTATISVTDTMSDTHLLGKVFGVPSFRVWVAVAAVAFGLGHGLSVEDQAAVAALIGGRPLPAERVGELWIIASRRAGKSIFASAVAIHLAAFGEYTLAPGEVGTVIVISPSQKQSRVIKRYISGLMHASLMLRALIANETADEITLTNGHVIEVVTASKAAPRGRTLIAVVVDEGAFLPSDDSAAEPLGEILAACRPGLATTDGLLVVIGSPYAQAGPMFEAFTRHYAKDSNVLVVKGASQAFNPTIRDSVVAQAVEADPASARAEWFGEFRNDRESYVTREAVQAVVAPGRIELPRVPGVMYRAFLDFAGGSIGGDSATLAIAHDEDRAGRRVVIVDLVREVRAPFSPEQACQELADTMRAYAVQTATSDKWGGMFVVEQMAKLGIRVVPSAKAKSDLYREMLPLVNSGGVELLDHQRLLAQLVGLERRTGSGGRDAIDHVAGGFDDLVNAVAGVVTLGAFSAHPGGVSVINAFSGEMITGIDRDGIQWKNGSRVEPPNFTIPDWYPSKVGVPIPTIKIQAPNDPSSFVIINQSDFSAAIHTPWHEPVPQPAPDGAN